MSYDASKGTVRKWYTEDASQVGDLYTTDKNESFVPFTVEFEVAFACAEGGNYRVLYMTKTYEYTTFDQTHDIEFNSADLASQNNITGSNVDGNKLIFPDYSQYNYEDPRIVYIRSTIINNDLEDCYNQILEYIDCEINKKEVTYDKDLIKNHIKKLIS